MDKPFYTLLQLNKHSVREDIHHLAFYLGADYIFIRYFKPGILKPLFKP